MFFLNLSLPEFLAIAGALTGLITVLYFFDRSKRKKTVSTLRFWTDAVGAQQQKRRKSVRQPWSLLLQLLSVLLLLLAIARVQWGSRNSEIRNTVLLLDTSSASSWHVAKGTVLDREKSLALQYLSRLTNRDRVMLVRVDGLASPATSFIADGRQLRTEINSSNAGYSALNIQRALTYARYALRQASGSSGEVVYIGPERVSEPFSGSVPGLRVLATQAGRENCGIRGIVVSRAEGEEIWRAVVTLRNDGTQLRALQVSAHFATTPFALRRLVVQPHEEASISYQFVANSAGRFNVRLLTGDQLPADDEASVLLPLSRPAKVVVYTTRQDVWRPLLDPDKSLDVRYEPTERYAPHPEADVAILDHFAPRTRPAVPSLWVDVPADGSPLPVKSAVASQSVTRWNNDSELGAGLHARDLLLPKAKVFQTFDKDFVVASTAKGPVAVVRPASDNGERLALVGFDFLAEPLRYRVSSPILFANLMRWLAPEAFHAIQISAEPVGLSHIPLDSSEDSEDMHVTDQAGRAVPFLMQNSAVEFFVDAPRVVHIITGQRERYLSLILPQIASEDWKVPADVPRSMPGSSAGSTIAMDLWQILACLGGLGLILEWFLFGRSPLNRFRPRVAPANSSRPSPATRERELVAK